jgi:predicted membrane channel-forming protein YqfA (hemolysin III family)
MAGASQLEELFLNTRARKLVGGAAMLAFVVFYALIAMALAQARPMQEAPALVQTVGYIVLGLIWVLPLMPLIKWMEGRKK